jgi:hypothetical protein
MQDFPWADFLPKMIGVLTVTGTIIVALFQYKSNSRSEQRLRSLAELESDIKVSAAFSELIEVANGYRSHSEPQKDVIEIIGKNIPLDLLEKLIRDDPGAIAKIFTGSIVTGLTPLARQLAAAESIANLAIKYPILLEPALIGLDCTVGLSPFATNAYDRLCAHYGRKRSLTDWGKDWKGMARQPGSADRKQSP